MQDILLSGLILGYPYLTSDAPSSIASPHHSSTRTPSPSPTKSPALSRSVNVDFLWCQCQGLTPLLRLHLLSSQPRPDLQHPSSNRSHTTPTNPLDTTPSSPQQIYLNLLILEASLRSQYLLLALHRRKYSFLLLIIILTSPFIYIIFINGPSPYYYIHLLHKIGCQCDDPRNLLVEWVIKKVPGLPTQICWKHKQRSPTVQYKVRFCQAGLVWTYYWVVSHLSCSEMAMALVCKFAIYPTGEAEKGSSFGEVLRSFLKYGHHRPPGPISIAQLTPTPTPISGRKRRPSQVSRNPTPTPCLKAWQHRLWMKNHFSLLGHMWSLWSFQRVSFVRGGESFERTTGRRRMSGSQRNLIPTPLLASDIFISSPQIPDTSRLSAPPISPTPLPGSPPSPRRGTTEPPIARSRSRTPGIILRSSTPDLEVSGIPKPLWSTHLGVLLTPLYPTLTPDSALRTVDKCA